MSVKLFVQHSHSICTAGKIEYKASTLPELDHYGKRHILGQSISEHVLCLNVVDRDCSRLIELSDKVIPDVNMLSATFNHRIDR